MAAFSNNCTCTFCDEIRGNDSPVIPVYPLSQTDSIPITKPV